MGRWLNRGLAFAVLIGAAPALADVTAQYVSAEGQPFLKIEADNRGNMRVEDRRGYYLVTRAGEYLIEPGPGGPTVMTLEAAIALAEARLGERLPRERVLWRYAPTGTAQVGAWAGRAYRAAGEDVPPLPPVVVISQDPRLAPLGRAQLRAARAGYAAARRPNSNEELSALLSPGAVLSMGSTRIDGVSFEPIAPERFALPAKPITRQEIAASRASAAPVPATEQRAASIVQAVFHDGALWTRDEDGGLARTPEWASVPAPVDAPERAVALCTSERGLWLVTQSGADAAPGLWLRRAGQSWDLQGRIAASPTSRFLGFECSGDLPWLLFADRLVEGAGQRALAFDPKTLPQQTGFSSLQVADGALYVAMNLGEWGGGIHRITLPRAVPDAQAVAVEALCSRAQPAACRAITGLAADPARPGCLLASLGLVHFFPSGEVVRVCGSAVERIYRKPYTIDPEWTDADADRDAMLGTVPFYALASGRDDAWAVADDGVYRFREGEPELRRFPPLRPRAIDWSHPGVVLVPTDMNQRHSLSGGSLLMAVR